MLLQGHGSSIEYTAFIAQDGQSKPFSPLLQVSHPEDRRNFSGGAEDAHPASKSNKRYASTGLFKDF